MNKKIMGESYKRLNALLTTHDTNIQARINEADDRGDTQSKRIWAGLHSRVVELQQQAQEALEQVDTDMTATFNNMLKIDRTFKDLVKRIEAAEQAHISEDREPKKKESKRRSPKKQPVSLEPAAAPSTSSKKITGETPKVMATAEPSKTDDTVTSKHKPQSKKTKKSTKPVSLEVGDDGSVLEVEAPPEREVPQQVGGVHIYKIFLGDKPAYLPFVDNVVANIAYAKTQGPESTVNYVVDDAFKAVLAEHPHASGVSYLEYVESQGARVMTCDELLEEHIADSSMRANIGYRISKLKSFASKKDALNTVAFNGPVGMDPNTNAILLMDADVEQKMPDKKMMTPLISSLQDSLYQTGRVLRVKGSDLKGMIANGGRHDTLKYLPQVNKLPDTIAFNIPVAGPMRRFLQSYHKDILTPLHNVNGHKTYTSLDVEIQAAIPGNISWQKMLAFMKQHKNSGVAPYTSITGLSLQSTPTALTGIAAYKQDLDLDAVGVVSKSTDIGRHWSKSNVGAVSEQFVKFPVIRDVATVLNPLHYVEYMATQKERPSTMATSVLAMLDRGLTKMDRQIIAGLDKRMEGRLFDQKLRGNALKHVVLLYGDEGFSLVSDRVHGNDIVGEIPLVEYGVRGGVSAEVMNQLLDRVDTRLKPVPIENLILTAATHGTAAHIRHLHQRYGNNVLKRVHNLSPLAAACKAGNYDAAEAILALSPEPHIVNEKTNNHYSPLYYAVLAGNTRLAELLVSYGADIHADGPSEGNIVSLRPLVEIARSMGHSQLADQMENWSATYRSKNAAGTHAPSLGAAGVVSGAVAYTAGVNAQRAAAVSFLPMAVRGVINMLPDLSLSSSAGERLDAPEPTTDGVAPSPTAYDVATMLPLQALQMGLYALGLFNPEAAHKTMHAATAEREDIAPEFVREGLVGRCSESEHKLADSLGDHAYKVIMRKNGTEPTFGVA